MSRALVAATACGSKAPISQTASAACICFMPHARRQVSSELAPGTRHRGRYRLGAQVAGPKTPRYRASELNITGERNERLQPKLKMERQSFPEKKRLIPSGPGHLAAAGDVSGIALGRC
jgi:hypothetical protein